MGDPAQCSECKTPLSEGARFCGKCGAETPEAAAPPGAAKPAGNFQKTMMAFAVDLPKPPGAAPASPSPASHAMDAGRVTDPGVSRPPPGAVGRTVMGISSSKPPAVGESGSGAKVAPKPVAAAEGPAHQAPYEPASVGPTSEAPVPGPDLGAAGRTMMGMPNVAELRKATEAAKAAAETRGVSATTQPGGAQATRQPGGMNASTQPGGMNASTQPGVAPDASQASARVEESGRRSSKLSNTVVGIDAADLPPAALEAIERAAGHHRSAPDDSGSADNAAQLPPARAKGNAGGVGGRTMLGVGLGEGAAPEPAPEPMPAAAPEPRSAPRPAYAGAFRDPTTDPITSVKRSSTPLIVGLLLLVALAGAAFFALRGESASSLVVDVVREAGVEYMEFTAPGAPAGTKLRFGGQEKVLEAGRTRFQLAPDSLTVGKNAVLVELVDADGSVASEHITLELQHRVTLDTSPLRSGKSSVDVVVAAAPGSTVALDGEGLTLDEHGRGVRSDPLELGEAATAGSIEHVVQYRVQPPEGEPIVGELRTRIPVASMQIDRPGQTVVTDSDAIEIAGAVERDTEVSIDGEPVPVKDGRFLYRLPLSRVGVFEPKVMATADAKAPNIQTVRVERVAVLAEAAAGFKADPTITYSKIVQNPSIYRGQKVAFEGRVYNVAVDNGRSVLQVLVRECPAGTRCPLWVTYPAATDFTVDRWVRALGEVAGEQQFRAENDEIRSVPKLEATFLLPAEP